MKKKVKGQEEGGEATRKRKNKRRGRGKFPRGSSVLQRITIERERETMD